MIRQICFLALGLALCLFCSSSLDAQVIAANINDASVRSNGGGPQGEVQGPLLVDPPVFGLQNLNAPQIRTGRFFNATFPAGIHVAAVFVFELPDLGPVADPFEAADLEFSVVGVDPTEGAPTDYNADLYGIARRDEPDLVAVDDFFAGPAPDVDGILLQEDIITPDNSEVGRFNSVDIADYLNAQYEGGAGAGQFVFLRLSPDFDPTTPMPTREGYLFGAANNIAPTLAPVINFTEAGGSPVLRGDVDLNTEVNFDDIGPFIAVLSSGGNQAEADIDGNGMVEFGDIAGFIMLLSGG